MNRISAKLKSQAGASILMAMVLFLICGFVAAVTLGAAATNAQKYRNQREQQQIYLAVSSSARMLEEMLEGRQFTGTEDKWIYYCRDIYPGIDLNEGDEYEADRYEVCEALKTEVGDTVQALIAEGLYSVYLSKTRYVKRKPFAGWTKEIKIRFPDIPELVDYPVNAVVTVDRSYQITITLKTAAMQLDNTEYVMVLTFKADVKEQEVIKKFTCEEDHHGTIKVQEDDGKIVEESVSFRCEDNEHYTKTTTIRLIDGDIRKGA